MTKTELARAVGVTLEAVIQWENGDSTPTTDNLGKIAEAVAGSLSVFWGDPPAKKKRARAS